MLKLKNTYTKAVEEFAPRIPESKTVLFYSCGPTVYSYAHIGNMKSFLMADVLRRTLEKQGYRVRQVMNITDVGHMTEDHLADATGEDKLSKAARELGTDPYKVAQHFESAFVEDAKALRLKIYQGDEASDPSLHPRATGHVAEMLVMIDRLLKRGFAYSDSAGQVYFDVAKFPEYGALSGKVLEDLEAGARVAVREEKKDPRDFALWKVDDKHLMKWDPHSPQGWPQGDWERFKKLAPDGVDARIKAGFPGWHIECSAMSHAHLGPVIDLHTGGEDNIFPHHECEIAQSFAAAEEPNPPVSFSKYWVHGRHLLVDGKKMSKRDGTFFTARELFDPKAWGRDELAERLAGLGFAGGKVPPTVLRYALISNQYTQPMNFSFDVLAQAKANVDKIQNRYERLVEAESGSDKAAPSKDLEELVRACEAEFDSGLADNLNMPVALAALFKLIGELNQRTLSAADARVAREALDRVDGVLDVLDRRVRSGVVPQDALAAADVAKLPSLDALRAVSPLTGETVQSFVLYRQASKKSRDFATADAIRRELDQKGVLLEDLPAGVRWRFK
ncbi:MAG: cysteine--tRNA ligase [Polyangiaceae bacterium]